MSIILIIDEVPKQIVQQFGDYKGVTFFTSESLSDAKKLLTSGQFDYVFCDYDIALNTDDDSFREQCKVHQPYAEFYYLFLHNPQADLTQFSKETSLADGIIRGPVDYSIFQLIIGADLIDQGEIDALFRNLKKA